MQGTLEPCLQRFRHVQGHGFDVHDIKNQSQICAEKEAGEMKKGLTQHMEHNYFPPSLHCSSPQQYPQSLPPANQHARGPSSCVTHAQSSVSFLCNTTAKWLPYPRQTSSNTCLSTLPQRIFIFVSLSPFEPSKPEEARHSPSSSTSFPTTDTKHVLHPLPPTTCHERILEKRFVFPSFPSFWIDRFFVITIHHSLINIYYSKSKFKKKHHKKINRLRTLSYVFF